jgi:L-alanine-DL-glutamate epimerase-like enolase superfamily enzyme
LDVDHALAATDPQEVASLSGAAITAVRVHALRADIEEPVRMSFSFLGSRDSVLVEVECEDGTTGFGESWVNYPPWAIQERIATVTEGVAPLLLGRDAGMFRSVVEEAERALAPIARQWGAPGPVSQALSGAEAALWDIAGRRLNVPAHELMGGAVRRRIPVYASGVGPRDVRALATRCLREGFGALKLRIGFGRETDEANLSEVRRVVDDAVELMVDVNQAWGLTEAIEMAPLLQKYAVRWVEEPVRGNKLEDLERLYEATGIAIATGENLYGLAEFLAYVESPAVAIIQPDVTKVGGLGTAMAITQAAHAAGKQVAPHFYGGGIGLAATIQLAAASPAVTSVEYDIRPNPLREGLLAEPLLAAEGHIAVPYGPGLGVMPSPDALRRWEFTTQPNESAPDALV